MRYETKKELRRGPERGERNSGQLIFRPHCSTKYANLRDLFYLLGQAVYQGNHKVVDSIWGLIDKTRGIG